MNREEIIFFLMNGLEWLIPAGFEKEVEEIKRELHNEFE